MDDESMQHIESIVTALRQEVTALRQDVFDLRSDVRGASALGATAQAQVTAHVAVCDERQRLTIARQVDRDRWHDDQSKIFSLFMTDSTADRARIRESILTAAASAREDHRMWMIRLLSAVAGFNILGAAATVWGMLRMTGVH